MKIFIIGSGNVASALGNALFKAGHAISGIAGRNTPEVEKLSKRFHCKAFKIPEIPSGSDVYLIAVKDDAIIEVAGQIPQLKGVVAHTSGSTSIDVLDRFARKGVFYPVQTIHAGFRGSFRKVPFCIESSEKATLAKLINLAKTISGSVHVLNSSQRATLHLAAVFTNNFNNHLLAVSAELLKNNNLPFSLLKELALSTVNNAFDKGPLNAQTGPASRNDRHTIEKHLKLMKKNKSWMKIYELLTREIMDVHNRIKKK